MKKTANSGKKQRLKLQQSRLTQRSATTRQSRDTVTVEAQAAHDFRLKGVPKDLFTVFHVREASYEVEKRIIAARSPLQQRGLEADERLYGELVSIPTRPAWQPGTKARRLQEAEEAEFERYLSSLYARYPPSRLNHFEHNLQVWRQLWRAVELADVVVLSLDARHPQFHLPPSLLRYITHEMHRQPVLLLNKVDLVDEATLSSWERWLQQQYAGLPVLRFSSFPNGDSKAVSDDVDVSKRRKEKRRESAAGGQKRASGVAEVMAQLQQMQREKQDQVRQRAEEEERKQDEETTEGGKDLRAKPERGAKESGAQRLPRGRDRRRSPARDQAVADALQEEQERNAAEHEEAKDDNGDPTEAAGHEKGRDAVPAPDRSSRRRSRLTAVTKPPVRPSASSAPLDAANAAAALAAAEAPASPSSSDSDELLPQQSAASSGAVSRASVLVVAVIGHPNTGKSSFINALFGRPVVSASETPGHTKHLQTLALTPELAVVDVPGLVFPAVDMPRELQVLCGLFPISQLSEPYSSIAFLAERVPLHLLYGLKRVSEDDGEQQLAADGLATIPEAEAAGWSAWELCESLARQRNFRLQGGGGSFDTHRAANTILQDVLHGVVLFNFKAPAPEAAAAAAAAAS